VAHVRTRHRGIELQIIDAAARQLQEHLCGAAGGLAVEQARSTAAAGRES